MKFIRNLKRSGLFMTCRRRFDELHDAVLALGYVVSSVPLDATMVERIEGEVRGSDWRLLRWSRPAIEGGIVDAPTAQAFGDITTVPTLFLFDQPEKKDGESRFRSPT
jgi:hypothetical protein